MEPRRHPVLDEPTGVRKQVAGPWLKRRQTTRTTPHLDDDRSAAEPFGHVAGVSRDELEPPAANAKAAELDPPPNGSRHTYLDRHSDAHLHADACTARAARGQEHERGPVAGWQSVRRRHAQANRPDTARSDDDAPGPDDDERGTGRRANKPWRPTQIERQTHRANGHRHR